MKATGAPDRTRDPHGIKTNNGLTPSPPGDFTRRYVSPLKDTIGDDLRPETSRHAMLEESRSKAIANWNAKFHIYSPPPPPPAPQRESN
jgi:hypothetical protein